MNIPVSLYPRKTREMHNHHFDSTIWNDFREKPGSNILWRNGRLLAFP